MRTLLLSALLPLLLLLLPACALGRYSPDWKSLDARPLPAWYDQSKIGIFIHWGVFSVPSYRSEWFWWYWKGDKPEKDVVSFMKKNYRPDFTYADFAPQFKATFFDPDHWAEVFESSGAKYVVLTSKHHEGFCNWDTAYSFNWNSVQVGPRRDLVSDLAKAIRKRPGLHFGLYHSLFEWFNPMYLSDKRNNFTTDEFVQAKTMPELYELVQKYKPDVVWSDGDAGPVNYWNSTGFLAWLYNDSPVKDSVVTNDRWGSGTACKHGGYFTCADRYNPGTLQGHKWENCMTLDKSSWGYRRNAAVADYLSIEEVLDSMASTVSCGGNVLLNVGPTMDGTIDPLMEERLRQMGAWLRVNGEAIYNSTAWRHQNDTVTKKVWYTQANSGVFAILLSWPASGVVRLGAVTAASDVRLLGFQGRLKFNSTSAGLDVTLPNLSDKSLRWAWVLRLQGAKPRVEHEAVSRQEVKQGVRDNVLHLQQLELRPEHLAVNEERLRHRSEDIPLPDGHL